MRCCPLILSSHTILSCSLWAGFQLANGGRLVVPVGEQGMAQVLLEIQRTGHTFAKRELMGVAYVPLVRDRTEL